MRDGLYQVRFAGAIGQQGGYDVDYELPKPVHAKLKDPGKPPASPTQLRWKILSLGYFDQKTQQYHVIQNANPIAPMAAGNAISYPQIFTGIDLNYTCGNTRL